MISILDEIGFEDVKSSGYVFFDFMFIYPPCRITDRTSVRQINSALNLIVSPSPGVWFPGGAFDFIEVGFVPSVNINSCYAKVSGFDDSLIRYEDGFSAVVNDAKINPFSPSRVKFALADGVLP